MTNSLPRADPRDLAIECLAVQLHDAQRERDQLEIDLATTRELLRCALEHLHVLAVDRAKERIRRRQERQRQRFEAAA